MKIGKNPSGSCIKGSRIMVRSWWNRVGGETVISAQYATSETNNTFIILVRIRIRRKRWLGSLHMSGAGWLYDGEDRRRLRHKDEVGLRAQRYQTTVPDSTRG